MPSTRSVMALAAAASTANAAYQGFNYGATFSDGTVKVQSDYESDFKNAAGLEGTDGGFTSARLYTMIQGSTSNPNEAIPAAISTKTSLLLGIWASAGEDAFNNEITALQNTIDQYCDQLDGLVAGLSVGSEDLYRNTPTGIKNAESPGLNPDVLVDYIATVRKTIKGTCLSDVPIGHVDTWTAYDNSSNSAVIDALDWVGMDAYAYFEDTKPNGIENGASLFESALETTKSAAGGKDVWITETGWPVSGDDYGDAVASLKNARTFYEEVGCPRFGNVNIWWYTFQDSNPTTPNPSFGVIGSELTTKPLFDLSCDSNSTSTTSSATSKTSAKSTSTKEASKDATSSKEVTSTKESSSAEATSAQSKSTHVGVVPVPVATKASTSSPAAASPSPAAGSTASTSSYVVPAPVGTPSAIVSVPANGNGTVTSTPSTTGGNGAATTTSVPVAGSSSLNSLGAAVIAAIVAVAML